jgi:protein TonB
MRNTLLASLFAHILATLLFGVVSIMMRQPLQPAEYIKVDLATLPAQAQERKVEPPKVEKKQAPPPKAEPKPLPPEPEKEQPKPEKPKPVETDKPAKKPQEQVVPPRKDLPAAKDHEKPKPEEDLDFSEPKKPQPAAADSARAQEGTPASQTSGVEIQQHEGLPDYYLALLQRKIDRRWEPSAARARGGPAVSCLIRFRVTRGGVIEGPQIVESSGFSVFDREALRAVISASPLPPPPPGSRATEVPINVRFHLDQ